MYSKVKIFLFLSVFMVAVSCKKESGSTSQPPVVPPPAANNFTNPLLTTGPDPWVVKKDSFYYYMHTMGGSIEIWRTKKMSDLKNAPHFTVWSAPSSGPYSRNVWAPELHFINNKWYLYFAADDGNNANHRMYVLENTNADPLSANWVFKGKIADATDKWAIDGSVMEKDGQLYFLWSGWEGNTDGRQDIYIALMSDPYTISGNRVLISSPTFDWERFGGPAYVNEAPEALKSPAGKNFITYSASGCWTDNYTLGLLSLKDNGNPLLVADWVKTTTPVFAQSSASAAYGPGHNSFFKSVSGTEDWILYHANSAPGQGCGNARNPRIQKFTWNADGTPNFGMPVKINTAIQKPSGE